MSVFVAMMAMLPKASVRWCGTMLRRLTTLSAVLVLAACASGGFQADGRYLDEITIAAIATAMLADETADQIRSGDIAPASVPAAIEANRTLATVVSHCRGPAVSGSGGSLCIVSVANALLRMEDFLTNDPDSDEVDFGEAIAVFADAALSPDPRMIAVWLELDRLEPGELLSMDVVTNAFVEMDIALRNLDDTAMVLPAASAS